MAGRRNRWWMVAGAVAVTAMAMPVAGSWKPVMASDPERPVAAVVAPLGGSQPDGAVAVGRAVSAAAGVGTTSRTGGWKRPAAGVSRVVLVGDSLADEMSPFVHFISRKAFVPRFWGGTAPCDWVGRDLPANRSTVVVISFTGNSLTPCMVGPDGAHLADEALVARYHYDVGTLINRARTAGARVVLVGQPAQSPEQDSATVINGINEVYRSFAKAFPFVSFVDAGAAVEAPGGVYADRLPCLPVDPDCGPDSTTVVRSDGVHFCPAPVAGSPCPVWSSGAFRFGATVAMAVLRPQRYE